MTSNRDKVKAERAALLSPLIGEPWACRRLLPRFDELSPDCKGVILSIAFNRDAGGFNKPGTRWTEMRQIKAAIGLA